MSSGRYILGEKDRLKKKKSTEEVTRILALIFALISVFGFFVKLIFF